MKASKSMWLVLALFTLWFPIPASALVQFSYTGEHFENFGGPPCLGCSISGHFATAATLPADMSEVIVPLSFSFSDGRHSITDTNATYSFFWLVTGHDGRIISWKNLLFSDEAKIYSGTNPAGCQGCSVVDVASDRLNTYFANIQDHPGTWAITVSVPEPSAYALMLAGLGALTMVARGKIEQLR